MKVCVVTCTGKRPELFALCRKWVERQTVKPDHWLVVTDDGDQPDVPDWADSIKIEKTPPTQNIDIAPNTSLATTLRLVPAGHAVVVFEDDDWYRADHIAICMREIEKGHLVTYSCEVWQYHIPLSRWRTHQRPGASEGRVGLHPDGVSEYADHLLDRPLWSGPTDGRYSEVTSVGIKGVGYGLPGRPGASLCHHSAFWPRDPQHAKRREWLGEDATDYTNLL